MPKNVALSLSVPVEVRDALHARAAACEPPAKPATLAAHLLAKTVAPGGLPLTTPSRLIPEPEWSKLDSARQKALDIAINFSGGDPEEPTVRVADAAMELIGVVAEVLSMRGGK